MIALINKKYNNIMFMCFALAVAVAAAFFTNSAVSIMIVIGGIFLGLYIISMAGSNEDKLFLSNIFLFAFLARLFAGCFLYNLIAVRSGQGFLWDGVNYAENGRRILHLWLSGIRDLSEIKLYMLKSTVSGVVSAYDFWNAIVYFFAGVNPYALIFINSLVFSLSLIFVYMIAKKICCREAAVIAVSLTAFWPSMFLWSIQNFKEPITVFLTVVLMWAIISLNSRFTMYYIFSVAIATTLLISLRGFLIPIFYGSVIMVIIFGRLDIKKAMFFIVFALFFFKMIETQLNSIALIKPYLKDFGENKSVLSWIYEMRTYRTYSANSAFFTGVDFRSLPSMIVYGPAFFLVALLGPFPWQTGSFLQILSVPEMCIYYFFIPAMFFGARFFIKHKKIEGFFLIVFIFFMTIVLAFIEGNLGTLFRHRAIILPFMFILVAVGITQTRNRKVVLYEK